MTRDAGELRLRRLLRISGPVPWAAKAPLLETLAQQLEWRASVRGALAAADTDYFGRQDKAAAQQLLDEIDRRSLS